MRQVGWMNPKNGLFCGTETKSHGLSDEYTEPVYVDDKVPEQVESNKEILLQMFENQQIIMRALQVLDEMKGSQEQRDLDEIRKKIVEILEKERQLR